MDESCPPIVSRQMFVFQALKVSDHYPVEVELRSRTPKEDGKNGLFVKCDMLIAVLIVLLIQIVQQMFRSY